MPSLEDFISYLGNCVMQNWPRCFYYSKPRLTLHKLFPFATFFSQEIVCDLKYIDVET